MRGDQSASRMRDEVGMKSDCLKTMKQCNLHKYK